MADYKGIRGFTIQSLSADPPAPIVGQVWYNTTSTVLKGYISGAGAWASGSDLNQLRTEAGSAKLATQSTAMIFGGNYPGPGYADQTEQYDGTSWTEVNDLVRGRSLVGGLGTNTAAMCVSGNYPTDTNYDEIWDGTSWSETANTNTRRVGSATTGTTTAALIAGGTPAIGGVNVEIWNGTSWSEVADLSRPSTQAGYMGSVGTTTAARVYGGSYPVVNLNEVWNGTSWTAATVLGTARGALASFGITTAAMAVGGTQDPPQVANTEKYDGTSWTELADISTARTSVTGVGTTASGLVAGGNNGSSDVALTEEWVDPALVVKTFTAS